MRIHNLYTDDDGESHFRDLEIDWAEERGTGKFSQRLPATGIIFRETGADYDLDWHPAPRRQYIINLDAGVRITASDGESRVIGAGEVILVEDTRGKGHGVEADMWPDAPGQGQSRNRNLTASTPFPVWRGASTARRGAQAVRARAYGLWPAPIRAWPPHA